MFLGGKNPLNCLEMSYFRQSGRNSCQPHLALDTLFKSFVHHASPGRHLSGKMHFDCKFHLFFPICLYEVIFNRYINDMVPHEKTNRNGCPPPGKDRSRALLSEGLGALRHHSIGCASLGKHHFRETRKAPSRPPWEDTIYASPLLHLSGGSLVVSFSLRSSPLG